METVLSASRVAHEMLGLSQTHTAEMTAQYMALGTMVVAVVENARVVHALGGSVVPKLTRRNMGKALEGFVPLLLQCSPHGAARLEVFRTETLVTLQPVEIKQPKAGADKEIDDILDGELELGVDSMVVEELPVINTRAGLYVYFNALVGQFDMSLHRTSANCKQLVARPLIDDNAIFAYLNNRYQVSTLINPSTQSQLTLVGRYSFNHD
jgi:mediator of RNA polymerase II transcription subunit 5